MTHEEIEKTFMKCFLIVDAGSSPPMWEKFRNLVGKTNFDDDQETTAFLNLFIEFTESAAYYLSVFPEL